MYEWSQTDTLPCKDQWIDSPIIVHTDSEVGESSKAQTLLDLIDEECETSHGTISEANEKKPQEYECICTDEDTDAWVFAFDDFKPPEVNTVIAPIPAIISANTANSNTTNTDANITNTSANTTSTDTIPAINNANIANIPPTVDANTDAIPPITATNTDAIPPTTDANNGTFHPIMDTTIVAIPPTIDTNIDTIPPTIDANPANIPANTDGDEHMIRELPARRHARNPAIERCLQEIRARYQSHAHHTISRRQKPTILHAIRDVGAHLGNGHKLRRIHLLSGKPVPINPDEEEPKQVLRFGEKDIPVPGHFTPEEMDELQRYEPQPIQLSNQRHEVKMKTMGVIITPTLPSI